MALDNRAPAEFYQEGLSPCSRSDLGGRLPPPGSVRRRCLPSPPASRRPKTRAAPFLHSCRRAGRRRARPQLCRVEPGRLDGALRRYTVRTPYGDFKTTGDQLMRARIKELNALNALEKTNAAQKFGEAAVKAGLSPVIFAGNLIARPVDTTQNTIAGVGQFVNGVGSGFNNMGKSRDDAVASITGASKQSARSRPNSASTHTRTSSRSATSSTTSPAPPRSPISPSPARSS